MVKYVSVFALKYVLCIVNRILDMDIEISENKRTSKLQYEACEK